MFGIDANILALVGLVLLGAGALAYALLFNQVATERNTEKRINHIKSADRDRDSRMRAEARVADASKRKQTLQNSLKELEDANKDRDPKKMGVKESIRQAGMTLTMKQFIIISIISGIIFCILAFVLSGNWMVTAGGLILGSLGVPRWVIGYKKNKRMKAFLEEFPNAVDVITRGIKAGLPLNDCLGIIAREAKEPVCSEFKKILETQQLGVPMTEAIMKLYKNVPLTEANFFGIVISIQQTAGGNLSEALSNLSAVLRDRKKMKAKIQAMSSEAKASAGIIGSLPFAVTFLLSIVSPDYIAILFTHETGHVILLVSGFWMLMGVMVMKKMINFDF